MSDTETPGRSPTAHCRDLVDLSIANGSIEHFVQVEDALEGKQDEIYKKMFQIFYRILKSGGYLAYIYQ